MPKKMVIRGMVVILIGLGVLIGLVIFRPSAIFRPLRTFIRHVPFVDLQRETIYRKKILDFSIGILVGKDPFHLRETHAIVNPVLTAKDIDDVDASFIADPFIIHEENKWYMFFEVMNKASGNGDIGLAESLDGIAWNYRQIVLDEAFHLSYPHVFSDGSSYFMVPESNRQQEIRLYKATDFPLVWHYEATLLKGLNFTDSTLFQYDDRWWLFTEADPIGDGTLQFYHSEKLVGPWVAHPLSPIVSGDENIARPAGKVLFYQNRLFRVAQDDWPTYGNRIRIFQIDVLTVTDYIEHELCDLPEIQVERPSTGLETPVWRLDGFHQFDAHRVEDGSWLVCIDGLSRKSVYKQLVLKFRVPFTKIEQ
jgi:hypothetical protein